MANVDKTTLNMKCQEMSGKTDRTSICALNISCPVFQKSVFHLVCYCQSIFSTVSIITVMRKCPKIQFYRTFQNQYLWKKILVFF